MWKLKNSRDVLDEFNPGYLAMLGLLVFMVHISFKSLGSSSTDHSCLTWTIKGFNLELVCRASNISYPLYFRGTDGEVVGICTKIEQDCISFHKYGIIKTNLKSSEVILTLREIDKEYVNGIWTCENGENKFQTEVSTSKGIASATDIFIRGEIDTSSNKVKITCYSCRQPDRNNIEFLVEDESIDSISFNRETYRCINGLGVSHPDKFTCDPSGTSFVHIFELQNTSKGIHFSCDMRFVDQALSSRFMKKATIYFDGKRFYDNGSISETLKHANTPFTDENQRDVHNISIPTTARADDMGSQGTDRDRKYLMITVIVVTAIVFIWILISNVYLYCVYYKERTNEKHTKEAICLLSPNETINNEPRNKKFHSTKEDCMNVTKDVKEYELVVNNKTCAPCEKRGAIIPKATTWCFDCVAAFCHTCIQYHSSMEFADAHCVVKIRELPNDYDSPFLCSTHNQSKLEYMCGTHNEMCCQKCAVANHGCCDSVAPLKLILHRFKLSNMATDCQERIRAVSETLQKLIQNYKYNIRDIDIDKKQIQLQIDKDYVEMIANSDINSSLEIEIAIKNKKTRLNLDLINRIKKINSNIEGKIFELEIVLKTTKEHDYLLKFTLKNGSEKHSFLVMKFLETRLGNSESQLEKHVKDRICVNLRYERDINDQPKTIGSVETIYITPENIELRHRILRESQIPVTTAMSKKFVVLKWFNLLEFTDMNISGITITTSGSIILCDRGKSRIIVTNETGDKQTPLNLEYQPWEIAAIPYSEIIVIICTKYDFILFVDTSERSFIKKQNIMGSAQNCIACTKRYIILGGVKKIDIFTHKGTTTQYLQTVKVNFSVNSLSISEYNDIIYFSSNGCDKLQRVDMKGTTLFPFETKRIEIQTNFECIRVDEKNNIYFLDSTKHYVHELSKEGEDLGIVDFGIQSKKTKAFTFNNDYTKMYLLDEDKGRPCIIIFFRRH